MATAKAESQRKRSHKVNGYTSHSHKTHYLCNMKIKYLSDKVRAIKGLWYRKYYVVLDGRANSVTISKALYDHMMRYERTSTEIFVFDCSDTLQYGFAMREDFEALRNSKTAFCQLQFNEKYRKIGFRSEHPSVTAICDSYNLPLNKMVRLSVLPRKTAKGETFYEIQRPI